MHRTATTVAAIIVLGAGGLLTACSGSDESSDAPAADGIDAGYDDGDSREVLDTEDQDRDGMGETDDGLLTISSSSARRVIRTAELVIEVERPAEAADEVAAIAARAGGFVAEADLQRDRQDVVQGTITLRVPSERLFDVVEQLDELGVAVPLRRIDEQDVTGEATDLEARRTNLREYEEQLRALLADVRETTTRPDDLLTVFERIRGVREEIDRIDARLAVLGDQVALSTVYVTLRPAAAAIPLSDPTWQPTQTVREALTATARLLTGVADATIWMALTVLPLVLVIGIPGLGLLLLWRRYGRGRGLQGSTH
jgi:hypothetical protein